MKFVSTGEPTVFKFNSARRKNCYIEKPFHEQLDCIRRIENRPTWMLEEILATAWVHLRRLPVKNELVIPPPPDPHTPGWQISFYRKFRGLE